MKRSYVIFVNVVLFVSALNLWAAYKDVSADTLEKWITQGTSFDFLLIDVRNTTEATSIIATDVCKPYLLPWNDGTFTQTKSKLPKDTAIVIYCASGNRSGQAATALDNSGFKSVYSLTGGMSGWGSKPTKAASFIKPTAQLPEPSMHKKSTALRRIVSPAPAIREFWFSVNNARITSPISGSHTLILLNMQGKCVLSKQDPFVHSTAYPLNGLSEGFYVAKLESYSDRSVKTVRLIQQ
jgi:rhodanese-related sulfurtransferase